MTVKKPGQKVRGSDSGRPIMVLLDHLGQRWTLRILWELRAGRMKFRDLQNSCDHISPTLLNKRLKVLRELDIIDHEPGGYGFTKWGGELAQQLATLDHWATKWAKKLDQP